MKLRRARWLLLRTLLAGACVFAEIGESNASDALSWIRIDNNVTAHIVSGSERVGYWYQKGRGERIDFLSINGVKDSCPLEKKNELKQLISAYAIPSYSGGNRVLGVTSSGSLVVAVRERLLLFDCDRVETYEVPHKTVDPRLALVAETPDGAVWFKAYSFEEQRSQLFRIAAGKLDVVEFPWQVHVTAWLPGVSEPDELCSFVMPLDGFERDIACVGKSLAHRTLGNGRIFRGLTLKALGPFVYNAKLQYALDLTPPSFENHASLVCFDSSSPDVWKVPGDITRPVFRAQISLPPRTSLLQFDYLWWKNIVPWGNRVLYVSESALYSISCDGVNLVFTFNKSEERINMSIDKNRVWITTKNSIYRVNLPKESKGPS